MKRNLPLPLPRRHRLCCCHSRRYQCRRLRGRRCRMRVNMTYNKSLVTKRRTATSSLSVKQRHSWTLMTYCQVSALTSANYSTPTTDQSLLRPVDFRLLISNRQPLATSTPPYRSRLPYDTVYDTMRLRCGKNVTNSYLNLAYCL